MFTIEELKEAHRSLAFVRWEHNDTVLAPILEKLQAVIDAGGCEAYTQSQRGRKRSEAKTNAARLNGKKGGRPRKEGNKQ